jgi:hypothetical protein
MNRKGRWFWLCEIQMRKNEFQNETIETIYFGGGTPSVLTSDEINFRLIPFMKIMVDENQKSRSKPIG